MGACVDGTVAGLMRLNDLRTGSSMGTGLPNFSIMSRAMSSERCVW